MVKIDILNKVNEKIKIDGDDYELNINKKQLFKFYHKIKGLSPDVVELTVKQFVDDKKKAKMSDGYYNKEVIQRNIDMLAGAIVQYMEDEIAHLSEDDVEESVNVEKTYTVTLPEDQEEATQNDEEINL